LLNVGRLDIEFPFVEPRRQLGGHGAVGVDLGNGVGGTERGLSVEGGLLGRETAPLVLPAPAIDPVYPAQAATAPESPTHDPSNQNAPHQNNDPIP
jgi:hypothetical protein